MIIASFASLKEKKAFLLGVAFCLGMHKHKSMACDANTNNAYWVTTKSGHHYLIDSNGEIYSGRLKGQKVSNIKAFWKAEQNFKIPSSQDFDRAIDKVLLDIQGKSNTKLERESNNQTIEQVYGKEIKIGQTENPIYALVQAREGHIKGAYHRADIPNLKNIDIFWGNASSGLMHIIKRRLGKDNNRQRVKSVLKNLSDVIRHGKVQQHLSNQRNVVLKYNDYLAVISLSYKGDGSKRAVISGYKEVSK